MNCFKALSVDISKEKDIASHKKHVFLNFAKYDKILNDGQSVGLFKFRMNGIGNGFHKISKRFA